MKKFIQVSGPAAPLLLPNVDTDVIMPKQFLKGIDRAGLGRGAFHELRFDPKGAARPDFVLNQAAWQEARFLVVGPNFGCGSSREHAVWGLLQLGIRAVLGTSFADNAANNGLLLLSLTETDVAVLGERAADLRRNRFTIDLEAETIEADDLRLAFRIDPVRRRAMMRGLDAISSTLEHADVIRTFQTVLLTSHPWLA